MNRIRLSFLVLCLCATSARAGDWPEFLGPHGTARSSEKVPTTWSETKNLSWKVDLPGSGSSSPIIVGERVILTCYIEGESGNKRQVLCFNKETGEQLWNVDFPIEYREDAYQGYLKEHGYASNTPVSDGKDVYVFLGKGGVHSLSLDGKLNWSVDVGKGSSNREWGSAASLLLYENSVIVNAAEEAKAIIALNKTDGEVIWKQEWKYLELTFGTPRILTLPNEDHELIISMPGEIWAMYPTTGKVSWYCETPMTGNVTPSVIIDDQTVYSFGGYRSSGSIAVTAGGKSDVAETNVVWKNRSSSYVATPLLHKGKFYWIDDKGIAYCTSAKDGEVVYRERIDELAGGRPVYASPVLIGNNIYVVTRRDGTIVYPPTDTFTPLATNKIASDDTDFNASPAVSDGKVYLRSNQALYCIGALQ